MARLVLFGGTGFAGYNQLYNASYGLYAHNNTIQYDRDFELAETRKIEAIYKTVCKAFHDKNVVIMTHMPLSDWYYPAGQHRIFDYYDTEAGKEEYNNDHPTDNVDNIEFCQPGFVYVSGHTHKDYFYDDGVSRLYSDNQFGYNKDRPNRMPHLEFFDLNFTFDFFSDYIDGVHQISIDDYKSFCHGKNLSIKFNKTISALYMLKKNGYYCFIYQSLKGDFCLLHGGSSKRLQYYDINYYYDNMDLVISTFKNPLDEFVSFQKNISNEVQRFGGYGTIHGCIIDIDFYNHIYVNPEDGKITPYWARDLIHKEVYPSIPALLEDKCPRLFDNYQRMINSNGFHNLALLDNQDNHSLDIDPVLYLDTDIYKASRQLRKIQRLHSNILSVWPDKLPLRNELQ